MGRGDGDVTDTQLVFVVPTKSSLLAKPLQVMAMVNVFFTRELARNVCPSRRSTVSRALRSARRTATLADFTDLWWLLTRSALIG